MPVDLFVIRHAIAEARAPEKPDAERALTNKGRKRFAREVEGLASLGIRFDLLLHSPWRRAVETAELLLPLVDGDANASGPAGKRGTHRPGLDEEPAGRRSTPLLARAPTEALVRQLRTSGAVAVVGHQPWLGELAAWLAFGDRELATRLELKKGGVLHLEGPPRPGEMVLRGALAPRLLRKLAR